MVSKALIPLSLACALGLAGCANDENSPSMGAVPPKPNPDVINKMPPEIREQMNHVSSRQKDQADQMRKAAEAAKQQNH